MLKKFLACAAAAAFATGAFAGVSFPLSFTAAADAFSSDTFDMDYSDFNHLILDIAHTVDGGADASQDWTSSAVRVNALSDNTVIYINDEVAASGNGLAMPNYGANFPPVLYPFDSTVAASTQINTGDVSTPLAPDFLPVTLVATPADVEAAQPETDFGFDIADTNAATSSTPLGRLVRLTFESTKELSLEPIGPVAAILDIVTTARIGTESQVFTDQVTIYKVPEPGSLALLALGGLVGLIRRR